MSPTARRKAAIVAFVAAIVAWPVTTVTVFSSEPPGILGLSWLSLIIAIGQIVFTADVRKKQEDE